MITSRRVVRISLLSAALSLGAVGLAHAGPILVGEGMDALAVDDDGKITAEGKKTAIKELDKIPGEDAWDFTLYTELSGKAAEGPMYIEFYNKIQGNMTLVYRHEDSGYDGAKKYRTNFLLEGNSGFNKDRVTRVIVRIGKALCGGNLGKVDNMVKEELEIGHWGAKGHVSLRQAWQ